MAGGQNRTPRKSRAFPFALPLFRQPQQGHPQKAPRALKTPRLSLPRLLRLRLGGEADVHLHAPGCARSIPQPQGGVRRGEERKKANRRARLFFLFRASARRRPIFLLLGGGGGSRTSNKRGMAVIDRALREKTTPISPNPFGQQATPLPPNFKVGCGPYYRSLD